MPWLIGDETSARVLEAASQDLTLSSLLAGCPPEPKPLYIGYLGEGFSADLAAGRFLPQRVPLALRAGWQAVAVAARTPDRDLASRLGPFLAPTAPRPHAAAPLGFTLHSVAFLAQALTETMDRADDSLCWAAKLSALISSKQPVFCDPVLELALTHRTPQEDFVCRYRTPRPYQGPVQALKALLFPANWCTPGATKP
jgi:hypothetical protein